MSIEWNLYGQYERESISSQTFLKIMYVELPPQLTSFSYMTSFFSMLFWWCGGIPQILYDQTNYNVLADESMHYNARAMQLKYFSSKSLYPPEH